MKLLKTVAVYGFLAVWMVASNHCRLEIIPSLSFLVCCDHENTAPHQDDDCDTDGCAVVEGAFYKMDGRASVSPPPLVALTSLLSPLSVQPAPAASSPLTPDPAPPELPVTWQFSFRTAAPPRAPSIS